MKKMIYLLCVVLVTIAKPPVCTGSRASSAPYISGDSFRALADHVFDETDASLRASEVKDKDIIFIRTDQLGDFFSNVHPYITVRYILISHNSDHGAPGNYAKYLDDEKIIVWFGQNSTIVHHEKFIPIPIGIANQYIPHGNIRTFHALAEYDCEKKNLVGINFRVGTYRSERVPAYNYFASKPYCTDIFATNHRQYLINIAETNFIPSPRGNGLDCHRTWEALVMGSIPIVTSSTLDKLFDGLPVIIVPSWQDVSEEFLHKKYEEIKEKWTTFYHEKMNFAYWEGFIKSYKNRN